IIVQAPVPILEGDTVESLSARILEKEHELYPQAIQFMAQKRLHLEGRKVHILSQNESIEERMGGAQKK
ncbi:MAG: hypothetical protein E4H32_10560, partial [Nitrospirales bacterium]